MITSASNPRLKLVRKLASGRQRAKLGLFVCEGEDLVAAGWPPVCNRSTRSWTRSGPLSSMASKAPKRSSRASSPSSRRSLTRRGSSPSSAEPICLGSSTLRRGWRSGTSAIRETSARSSGPPMRSGPRSSRSLRDAPTRRLRRPCAPRWERSSGFPRGASTTRRSHGSGSCRGAARRLRRSSSATAPPSSSEPSAQGFRTRSPRRAKSSRRSRWPTRRSP